MGSVMKFLVISLLLVDVLHGTYIGDRPKCHTVTKDVCTDTVVKECDNPTETSVPAQECHSDYKTKCHTVQVPVVNTVQECHTEERTVVDHVTRKVCNTV